MADIIEVLSKAAFVFCAAIVVGWLLGWVQVDFSWQW